MAGRKEPRREGLVVESRPKDPPTDILPICTGDVLGQWPILKRLTYSTTDHVTDFSAAIGRNGADLRDHVTA